MRGRSPPTSADTPPPDPPRRLSLRRLAREPSWSRAIVTAWAVLVVVLLARVLGDPGVEISGDDAGLLPVEHRAPEDDVLLLLTIEDEALAEDQGGAEVLQTAAAAVAERLGDARIPLGPPAAELTAWLDAHALYLLPVGAHTVLTERLEDTAMTEAVDALKARLASPLYGLSGEDPRRDPLRLQELSREHAGRLTHLGNVEDMPAELTAAGDLLALDGHALLVQLRGPTDALRRQVESAIEGLPVTAALVGPGPRRASERIAIEERFDRLLTLTFAGLVLVLSLALRAIRPVLAIAGALATGLLGLLVLGPPLDPFGVPLVVLAMGFGCEGALHPTRISARGWPGAAVLGTALLPLVLSPYPAWQHWAVAWLVAMAAIVLLLRLAAPAALAMLRFDPPPTHRGFRMVPPRVLAVVLTLGALGAGAWALPRVAMLSLDRTPHPEADVSAERHVREAFYDPRLVVTAMSRGTDGAEALERSAEHARLLASLVPDHAARVDAPGRLVLPQRELEARQRSLVAMGLDERMASLRTLLTTRGFRPDAFGEFLRGATNLDDLPTPQAALEGPLGDWIAGYLAEDGTAMTLRVHLRPQHDAPLPRIEDARGDTITLRGPAIAARDDRQELPDWLGIYVACQLWLGALIVWLATRSLAIALACACAAFSVQTGMLAIMVGLGLPLGAAMLPALLLVGAAAMVAGGRACRAAAEGRRVHAMGLLLAGLCQAAAGVALGVSGHPLWEPLGLVVAIGAVLASGAGSFVAPGLMRVLGGAIAAQADDREAARTEPATKTAVEEPEPEQPEPEQPDSEQPDSEQPDSDDAEKEDA